MNKNKERELALIRKTKKNNSVSLLPSKNGKKYHPNKVEYCEVIIKTKDKSTKTKVEEKEKVKIEVKRKPRPKLNSVNS